MSFELNCWRTAGFASARRTTLVYEYEPTNKDYGQREIAPWLRNWETISNRL
jgi:hypothetical protein